MNKNSSRIVISAALCLIFVTFTAVANARPPCAAHTSILKTLSDKYEENRKAVGIVGGKQLMEIFVSKKGTWTVVITNPAGLSCVVAVGDSWEEAPKVAEGSPT